MTQRVIDIKVACLAILGVLRATAFAQLCEDSCSFFVTYKGEPRCRSPPLSEFEQATQIQKAWRKIKCQKKKDTISELKRN